MLDFGGFRDQECLDLVKDKDEPNVQFSNACNYRLHSSNVQSGGEMVNLGQEIVSGIKLVSLNLDTSDIKLLKSLHS